MARGLGALGTDRSKPLAVRLPTDLHDAVIAAAGGREGWPAWARDVLRRACGFPLDRGAGYQEGYAAGWNAANTDFRRALKTARGE